MSGRISPQAKNLLDAVLSVGVPRKEVRVTTETKTTREEDGSKYREYGHASASLSTRSARQAVEEHAQHLADRGVHVTRSRWTDCGHLGSTSLTSQYNPQHKIIEFPLNGSCLSCRTAAGEV